MKTTHSGMIETVKDQIVAAIKGTGNIVQATVDSVTQILATTIKDTGKVGTSVTDVIANVASGAIRGAVQVGADLGHAAKGIMLGVLRGTKQAGTAVLDTISHTAHVAIRDTAEVGGDVGAAATGLVEGAIEGAKELGVSAEDAAAAAADGALKAAGEVGSTAVDAVRKAVTKPIKGVKVVLKEPEMAKQHKLTNHRWLARVRASQAERHAQVGGIILSKVKWHRCPGRIQTDFVYEKQTIMNAELIKKALEIVGNPNILVNLISRRVRQLNAGGGADKPSLGGRHRNFWEWRTSRCAKLSRRKWAGKCRNWWH